MAEFVHSKVLFLEEDGTPIHFYMTPSSRRNKLKPYIEHGGGILSRQNVTDQTIKLAVPGQQIHADDYYDSKFIMDCVTSNRYLDPEKYRMSSGEYCVGSDEEWESCMTSNTSIRSKKHGPKKLSTLDEEITVLKFVLQCRKNNFKARIPWLKLSKTLGYPADHIKEQYKQIRKDLHKYPFSPPEKVLLMMGSNDSAERKQDVWEEYNSMIETKAKDERPKRRSLKRSPPSPSIPSDDDGDNHHDNSGIFDEPLDAVDQSLMDYVTSDCPATSCSAAEKQKAKHSPTKPRRHSPRFEAVTHKNDAPPVRSDTDHGNQSGNVDDDQLKAKIKDLAAAFDMTVPMILYLLERLNGDFVAVVQYILGPTQQDDSEILWTEQKQGALDAYVAGKSKTVLKLASHAQIQRRMDFLLLNQSDHA